MPTVSPQVDAYIERAADFARPILNRIRRVFHATCPEVVETMKWNTPFFEHNGILAGMAAFKAHVNLVFWKGRLMKDPKGQLKNETTMKGLRVRDGSEMPSDKVLAGFVKQAVALNETAAHAPATGKREKQTLRVPAYFRAALKKNTRAQATFEGLSHSHRKEYVQWVDQAKREETRQRRLARAMAQLAEGKSYNSKHAQKKRATS